MNRVYSVVFTGTVTTAGADADLLSLQPADDKPLRLMGWTIGQTSELGDAAEESVRITVRHMAATVTIGSGGSSPSGVPRKPSTDVAAGFTARVNDTTVSTTSGTSTIMEEMAWNIRNTPWEHWIPEEMRPCAAQTEALIVRMESTLADDITIAMTFWVEELI